MPSFTQRIQNLDQVGPVIEVILTASPAYLLANNIAPSETKGIKALAMVDTGASSTVISQGLAARLKINPVGTTQINTPSSTNVSCHQFDIRIIFPNNINIHSIIITEAPLQGQHIQCLIGRDVLKHGVLIYTGYDNSFTLSF